MGSRTRARTRTIQSPNHPITQSPNHPITHLSGRMSPSILLAHLAPRGREIAAMPEFTLPPLPYDYAALEPHIDTLTMQIHHDKHHNAYVTNLNAALKDHADLQSKSIEDLLK